MPAIPSLRIAIVDDDPGVRGSLDSLMRSAGLTPCNGFASAEALLAWGSRRGLPAS
jgi:FixJ family two-component response regulator